MSMTWNGDFTEAGDPAYWSKLGFLNMFKAAIRERWNLNYSAFPVPDFSTGNNVQTSSVPETFIGVTNPYGIATLQYQIEHLLSFPTVLAWVANPFNNRELLSFASARGKLGYATTTRWRRKRPREITSAAAAADTMGNPRVTGHRA